MIRTLRQCLVFGAFSVVAILTTLTVNAAPAANIIVNTVDDTTADDGECSLREAIEAANTDSAVGGCAAGSGGDTISFSIPGAGPHSIQLLSQLPAITTPIEINGYSQTGAQPNSAASPQALNTILKIVLDGSQIEAQIGATGLSITAGVSTIRGLVIRNFDVGIAVTGTGGATLAGNFIGTSVTGDIAAGNAGVGILIATSNNTIGGIDPADRNLISGNGGDGVYIDGEGADFNTVQGNLIGTNLTATKALGNNGHGVSVVDGPLFNTLRDNIISANGGRGIRIENSTSDTRIASNLIGTNGAGAALGNGEGGILARNSGPQTIGGLFTVDGCCLGNTIAFNQGNGVTIWADLNVSLYKGILSNRIYGNTGLGIDLANDGVTLNDLGDGDGESDANGLQNYPVLNAAQISTTNITIAGTLNSIAEASFRVEFFANDVCDPSGYGEGQRYLGTQDVTTDASGDVSFSVTLTDTAPSLVANGNLVTATATDDMGNTSEFSLCLAATGGTVLTPKDSLFLPMVIGESE